MKKLPLYKELIIAACLASLLIGIPIAIAYTCTATKAGNFSDTTVWSGCNSTYPHSGDAVVLASYVVTWDASAPATLGTFTSLNATAGETGQLGLDLSQSLCNSGCTLSATTITAGTKPSVGGVISVTGTTSNTLTINTGTNPNGLIGGSNSAAYGLNDNTTGTILFNGDATAGSNSTAYAIYDESTGNFTFTGNLYAATAIGFYNLTTGPVSIGNDSTITGVGTLNGFENHAAATITVGNGVTFTAGSGGGAGINNNTNGVINTGNNCTFTGGGNSTSYGFKNNSGALSFGTGCTFTGATGPGLYNSTSATIAIGNNCHIAGGNGGNLSFGVYNGGNGNITLGTGCILEQGSNAAAWTGAAPSWTTSLTNQFKFYIGSSYAQIANTYFPQQLPQGDIKSGVTSGTVTGNYTGSCTTPMACFGF